jgi:hypothetical protein
VSTILKALKKLEQEKEDNIQGVSAAHPISTSQTLGKQIKKAWLWDRGKQLTIAAVILGLMVSGVYVGAVLTRKKPAPDTAQADRMMAAAERNAPVTPEPHPVPPAPAATSLPDTKALPLTQKPAAGPPQTAATNQDPGIKKPPVSSASRKPASIPSPPASTTAQAPPARPEPEPAGDESVELQPDPAGVETAGSEPAEEPAEALPEEELAESQPTEEPAEPLPEEEIAGTQPVEESAEPSPEEEIAESQPAEELAETLPEEENAEPQPAEESAESLPEEEIAASRPTEETDETADDPAESAPIPPKYANLDRLQDGRLELQAISWADDPNQRLAVINNRIMRQGQLIDEYTIVHIGADEVVVKKGASIWKLIFMAR